MLPVIPRPPITAGQKRVALMVAGAVDLLQIVLIPALVPGIVADEVLDFAAAVILVGVCGFKWQFAAAFGLELLPVVGYLPTWTAVVLMLRVGPEGAVAARSEGGAGGKGVVDVEGVLVPPVRGKGLPKKV